MGTPGGRIAPPGLSRTSRIRAGPAGGAPVTARGGSGRPSSVGRPAAPGGDEYLHAQIYNSCACGGAEELKMCVFLCRGAGVWVWRQPSLRPMAHSSLTPGPVPTHVYGAKATPGPAPTAPPPRIPLLYTLRWTLHTLSPALRPAPGAHAPPSSTPVASPPPGARARAQRQVQHPGPARPRRNPPRRRRKTRPTDAVQYIIYCLQLSQALRLAVEGVLSTPPRLTTVKLSLDTEKPGILHVSRTHFQHKKQKFAKTATTRLHKKHRETRTKPRILHK